MTGSSSGRSRIFASFLSSVALIVAKLSKLLIVSLLSSICDNCRSKNELTSFNGDFKSPELSQTKDAVLLVSLLTASQLLLLAISTTGFSNASSTGTEPKFDINFLDES